MWRIFVTNGFYFCFFSNSWKVARSIELMYYLSCRMSSYLLVLNIFDNNTGVSHTSTWKKWFSIGSFLIEFFIGCTFEIIATEFCIFKWIFFSTYLRFIASYSARCTVFIEVLIYLPVWGSKIFIRVYWTEGSIPTISYPNFLYTNASTTLRKPVRSLMAKTTSWILLGGFTAIAAGIAIA